MIKISFSEKKLSNIKADFELIFVVNKNLRHKWVRDGKDLNILDFKGEADSILLLPHKKRLYIGIASLEHNELRMAAALAVRKIRKIKVKTLKLGFYGNDIKSGVRAVAEGFLLGEYQYDKHLNKKNKLSLKSVYISAESYAPVKVDFSNSLKEIKFAEVVAASVNFTRDLVNTPPSDLTPPVFSKKAREMAKEQGLQVKIYGKGFLRKEKMGAFLAVNRASVFPPQLIHLKYVPKNIKARVVLVGKGLTYDTGGLSLKPSESMMTMKMDMGGAAAVLGVIRAVSSLNLPVEVQAVIGATENAIGRDAYKPDDILKARNGKTIEVKNTDAEGRLVLADCLSYAQEQKPDYLIDVATLTGAAMIAFGDYTSGIMGFNNELKNQLIKASNQAGEYSGILPFNKFLHKKIKSRIADIRNTATTKYGGAITAALFLSEFITKQNKDKWAHIDIAGSAYVEENWGVNAYGATGAGVRTLVEFIAGL